MRAANCRSDWLLGEASASPSMLQIYEGRACVYVGEGPERAMFSAAWDNDEELCRMIHELNFGRYRSSQAA